MFTDLDWELFPDECEALAVSSQEHCYLIQKNGSSSLRTHAKYRALPILRNAELVGLDNISVVVRNPWQRYISGIQTFVEFLKRDNSELHLETCVWMANRYRFLNRHYLPQFLWILNLSRFINPRCKINLKDMTYLSAITPFYCNRKRENKQLQIRPDPAMDLWFFIDQILTDNIGKCVTWTELLQIYQQHPDRPLSEMSSRIKKINDVLS